MENFHYLMRNLLDEPNICGENVCFTTRSIQLLHTITELLKEENAMVSEETMNAFYQKKNMSAEEIYLDMIKRITTAPSPTHMIVYAEAIIPIIYSKVENNN